MDVGFDLVLLRPGKDAAALAAGAVGVSDGIMLAPARPEDADDGLGKAERLQDAPGHEINALLGEFAQHPVAVALGGAQLSAVWPAK